MNAEQLETEFSQRVTNISECPVCTEHFTADGARRPRLLPHCAHSLCSTCYEQISRSQLNATCPICRTQMRVAATAAGPAAAVPNNMTIIDMMELVSNWREMSCRQHAGRFAEIYCEDCGLLMCATCHFNSHRNHRVLLTAVVANQLHAQLSADVTELTAATKSIRDARQAQNDFDAAVQALEGRVRAEEIQRIQIVRQNVEQLVQQLRRHRDDRHRGNNLDRLDEAVQTAVRNCDAVNERPYELVRRARQLHDEAQGAIRPVQALDPHQIRQVGVRFEVARITGNLVGELVAVGSQAEAAAAPQPSYNEINARLLAATERERQLSDRLRQAEQQRNTSDTQRRNIEHELTLSQQTEQNLRREMNNLTDSCEQLNALLEATERREDQLKVENVELRRVVQQLRTHDDQINDSLRAMEGRRGRLEQTVELETTLRRSAETRIVQLTGLVEELTTRVHEVTSRSEERVDEANERLVSVIRRSRKLDDSTIAAERDAARLEMRQEVEREMEQTLAARDELVARLKRKLQKAERRELELRRDISVRMRTTWRTSEQKSTRNRRLLRWTAAALVLLAAVFLALFWNRFAAYGLPAGGGAVNSENEVPVSNKSEATAAEISSLWRYLPCDD